MKKRYSSVALTLLLAMALSACGNRAGENPSVSSAIEEDVQSAEDSNGEGEAAVEEALEDVSREGQQTFTGESKDNKEDAEGGQMQEMTVETGGRKFRAVLYDNETVRALQERLPMTLDMEELHGNEKFYYLDEELPSNSENIGNITAGDIMLFGSDCLVLFFEDFSTSYSYTRIGHIEEEEKFVNALSEGTVEVTFAAGD